MPIPIGAGTVPRDDPGPEAGQRDGRPTHHDGYAERGFVARANRSNLEDAGDEEYLGPRVLEVRGHRGQVLQLEFEIEAIVGASVDEQGPCGRGPGAVM
jgi:hypothetical protein